MERERERARYLVKDVVSMNRKIIPFSPSKKWDHLRSFYPH